MKQRLHMTHQALAWCMFLAVLTLFPGKCFCLEEVSDDELSTVCGREGVGILIDHIWNYVKIEETAFKDPDGLTGASDAAELKLNYLELDVFKIEAITRHADIAKVYGNEDFHGTWDAQWLPGDSAYVPDIWGTILTFDIVDRLPVMSTASNWHSSRNASANTANVAGIHIGLPTQEFFVDEITLKSITATSSATNPVNNGKSFGHFYFLNSRVDLINNGSSDSVAVVEVAPHQGCGVDIAFDNIVLFGSFERCIYLYNDTTDFVPERFRLSNLKLDCIHINTITDLLNGQPHSPGENVRLTAGTQTQACNVRQADNYNFGAGNWENRFLSLDITNTLPTMSAIKKAKTAGVSIGLPALEIYTDSVLFEATIGDDNDPDDKEFLGTYKLYGSEIALLGGRLELAPHNAYGMDVAIDDATIYMSLDRFAYLDSDYNIEYCINNMEWDTIQINAITLDSSGNLVSPGDVTALHFTHLNGSNKPSGFVASPLTIDLSARLPKMYSNTGTAMAGISVGLPTLEIYCDQVGIGSIGLHEQGTSNYPSFFQSIQYQGGKHAFLGGRIEIAPH